MFWYEILVSFWIGLYGSGEVLIVGSFRFIVERDVWCESFGFVREKWIFLLFLLRFFEKKGLE